ncbi:MobF family relaxase [Streptomyces bobili]|uniref:MobF family relaxase n=1 Tax=Streptomyces bobili TaxID=67280 RepID=UPI00341218F0
MMTIHKLTAGDGYRYYLREIATGDERRQPGVPLEQYQAARGVPEGVWMGAGAAELGLEGTVSEPQMKALFGEGLHPNADSLIADAIAAGASTRDALEMAKLGRRFYRYDQDCGPMTARIREAVAQQEDELGRPLSDEERAAVRLQVGAEVFLEDFARAPADEKELERFIRARTGGGQQAVAGLEFNFEAPEWMSKVAFGLGDEEACEIVVRAHDQAVRETLAWIEEHALATRTGTNGIAQEDVISGLIATRWRHFDNRLGEPALHDHVVVSTKVQSADGRWLSLDARLVYAMGVAASEFYNQRAIEIACGGLRVRTEEREVSPGRRPVTTLAGVPDVEALLESRRSRAIRDRTLQLVDAYRAEHHREPDMPTLIRLAQQATLRTRPPKKKARSLAELRARWRTEAVELRGAQAVDELLAAPRAAAVESADSAAAALQSADVAELAEQVLETVSEHRAVWGYRHVIAEARRLAIRLTGGQVPAGDLPDRVAAAVLSPGQSVAINPPELHAPFAPLQRRDGTNIFRRREHELYTSEPILAAEQRIVNAAQTAVIPAVTRHAFARVARHFQGPPLDSGQRRLAAEFACSERLVVAAVGPAGAGKTTALVLAADAVVEGGGRLIALAPSSRAAKVLADDVGCTAHTIHGWLDVRSRAAAEDKEPSEAYTLGPGDVVVVDEAGMAGTLRLARVVAEAEAAGAVVRLIGDPAQLAAVESGGVLRWLHSTVGVIELERLHRFRTDGEARASLKLREGDPVEAFDWYLNSGRVRGGDYEAMVDDVFAAWQRDTEAGASTLMVADSARAVADLNARAQAFQLAAGHLDHQQEVVVRGGVRAYVGDVLVTRRNERRLSVLGARDWVKNGDLWLVEYRFANGDVAARHTGHGGRVVLPADYLSREAELGYATTVHRAQGVTVERCHGLLTERTSRGSAYVAATRGRSSNQLYVVCPHDADVGDVLQSIASSERPSVSAHEEIRSAQERTTSLGQLAAEYAEVYRRASGQRLQLLVRGVLGGRAETVLSAAGWPRLERALTDAEDAGWRIPDLVRAAWPRRRTPEEVRDPARALLEAVSGIVEAGTTARSAAGSLARLSSIQLEQLLALSERSRSAALEAVCRADAAAASLPRPVTVTGREAPAWPARPHGSLSRSRLAAAVTTARLHYRRCAPQERFTAAEALKEILAEQQLRAAMRWVDRAREDYQREPRPGVSRTPGFFRLRAAQGPARRSAARTRLRRAEAAAARIRAEQHRRALLPHGPARAWNDLAPLPDWLAPAPLVSASDTPRGWRKHLAERRQVLEDQLRAHGLALAAAPPPWSAPLGSPPPAGARLRPVWERTAALVAAWRQRHAVPGSVPGIGACPRPRREADAWRSLRHRIDLLQRRAAMAAHGGDTPPGIPPSTTGSLSSTDSANQSARRLRIALQRAHLAVAALTSALPALDGEVFAQADVFADEALRRVLEGEASAAPWVDHLPPPDPEDRGLQEQWKAVIAAVAAYRWTQHIESTEPLGDATDATDARAQWTAAQSALEELQGAHVEQRLARLREQRSAPPADASGPAATAGSRSAGRARPSANDAQHRHRPPRPGGPGRPRR